MIGLKPGGLRVWRTKYCISLKRFSLNVIPSLSIGCIMGGALYIQLRVYIGNTEDMVRLDISSPEIITLLIKQHSIFLEHAFYSINHGDMFLLSQCIHFLTVTKHVLLMEAKFHLIERSVKGVFFVASDTKHEFHFLKVLHLDEVCRQTENVDIYILPTAVIDCNCQLLSWVPLHQPIHFKQIMHTH
jgi:hypothetical protein